MKRSVGLLASFVLIWFALSCGSQPEYYEDPQMRVVAASEEMGAAGENEPSGSLELISYAPEFIKPNVTIDIMVRPAKDLPDRVVSHRVPEMMNVELVDFPLPELRAPLRITGLKPGKYFVGFSVPVRIITQGDPPSPVTVMEILAWDGSLDDGVRQSKTKGRLSQLRWYQAKVEADKTVLVSALFLSHDDEEMNARLDRAANHSSRYPSQLGPPPQTDLAYGVDPFDLEDLISRTGKVLIPKGFMEKAPDHDLIWFLPFTDTGKVKVMGRLFVKKEDDATTGTASTQPTTQAASQPTTATTTQPATQPKTQPATQPDAEPTTPTTTQPAD
jgi:hypothetical protein